MGPTDAFSVPTLLQPWASSRGSSLLPRPLTPAGGRPEQRLSDNALFWSPHMTGPWFCPGTLWERSYFPTPQPSSLDVSSVG